MSAPRKKSRRPAKPASHKRLWLWPLFLFLIGFAAVFWVYRGLFAPLPLPEAGYQIEVEHGSSLRQLTQRLADAGMLPNAWMVRIWLHLHPDVAKLKPGVFLIKPPMSAVDLVEAISALEPINRLTVVEGSNYHELLAQLATRTDLQHLLVGKSDADLLKLVGMSETYPEGLFAPDTYNVAPGDSDVAVLKRLYQHQQEVLNEEWATRAPDLPYHTPYEALIMASIVERETGSGPERPEIAGVFVRRLKDGMRLQTDPTVIYGMGAAYQGVIHHQDLLHPTPYNTYVIDGLPPTPIALPGRAAIHAALHPAAGDALYFVARGDGTHQFSATLAEHNRAVQQFQLNRADNYRSSPAPQ